MFTIQRKKSNIFGCFIHGVAILNNVAGCIVDDNYKTVQLKFCERLVNHFSRNISLVEALVRLQQRL